MFPALFLEVEFCMSDLSKSYVADGAFGALSKFSNSGLEPMCTELVYSQLRFGSKLFLAL